MVTLVDPTLGPEVGAGRPTVGLGSLRGRRVGLLDNGKAGAAELLAAAGEILRRDYGVAEVVAVRKPDMSRPAPAAVLDALAGVDAVLSGVGD
ncbi:MAG: hypothetical protein K6V97_05610 [Actinomycetia bacterium]|nr:hypothetical protein [Actinomycetes bacterium]